MKAPSTFLNALSISLLSRASAGLTRAAAALHADGFCEEALAQIAKRRPERLKGHVLEKAAMVANRAVMAAWDREGLRHCAACPERFGLRKYPQQGGPVWLCPRDYPKEAAASAA